MAAYFKFGQAIGSNNYYYVRDHLASVREMSDSTGVIRSQYSYGPFGTASQYQSLASDFQYGNYYFHSRSGFSLSVTRLYNPIWGKWISRDPIEELGDPNYYSYVENDPISLVDPTGLKRVKLPIGKYAPRLGVPGSSLKLGCADAVNATTHRPPGRRPDKPPNKVHCYYDPNPYKAQAIAQANAKKCKNGAIFAKQGDWNTPFGIAPPVGPVDPSVVSDTPVNFVGVKKGQYTWMDGPLPQFIDGRINWGSNSMPHGYLDDNIPYFSDHPHTIWCWICD